MNCQEIRLLLVAYADGELDAAGDLEIEGHLRACADCARALEEQCALAAALRSNALRFKAPAGLRESVLGSLEAQVLAEDRKGRQPGAVALAALPRPVAPGASAPESTDSRASRFRRFPAPRVLFAAAAIFLFGALAGGVGFLAYSPFNQRTDFLAREVVAGHIRSLLAGSHLTDVLSGDRHTVKPWFEGKLDFSPPVADLATNGFPLVGGRLDYLSGRPVASLVYRRDKHVINVFVWPQGEQDANGASEPESTRQGYHLVRWKGAGMNWWAVSDLNKTELTEFAGLLRGSVSN